MFDITGHDISLLSDEDLRALVGRLCEAELRRVGLPRLNATWGGNQNASDGGIDVRVAIGTALPPGTVFARSNVGIQVKAEDMPRGKILAEMKPEEVVRPSIVQLAAVGGSYIIVSSKGSLADTALADRKAAMLDATEGIEHRENLHLDFYDRDRLATWVRDHAGILTWVRERIGRPISGWRPYDDWAASHEGLSGTYLVDESLRLQGPTSRGESESVIQGMNGIRQRLGTERSAVRLVGLSGVGKTRFVQALFDDRIGEDALAVDLAIYTNLSDNPDPQPVAVATQLIAQGSRQVLIVDNCTPELHRRLAEVCSRDGSRLSLLTVEYDVREDQPEGTDVFELQPSSDGLIEKLLLRRVDGLSQVNAKSIAAFANGNSRVALTLALTVDRLESVASLRDAELFERLFRQRHESSNSLLLSAQACSLAYSFQGEDVDDGPEGELSKLAVAVGRDARTLYTDVAELKRRDLVQQRGVWRALLPHAIANRLATMALENIPPADFDRLTGSASARLLKSISRRLGYLHTSPAAQDIVNRWLAEGGLLGNVEQLNETGKAMLQNVAPVNPIAAIDALERAVVRSRQAGTMLQGEEFRKLLLSLSFDASLFDKCVALILDLIEPEQPGRYANQVRNSFPNLFHLFLSGTHATIEQRCAVIDGLLNSQSEVRLELGFKSLEAMLQTSGFSSFHHFEFGGRSRDFGWHPRQREDVVKWFKTALGPCSAHDVRSDEISSRIRMILGSHLRSLWTEAELHDEVEEICREFAGRRFWPEGWTGIRSIRRWREEALPEEEDGRLAVIEAALSPKSLVDQVRARVLRNVRDAHDEIDFRDYEAQYARQQHDLIEIGKSLAGDDGVFEQLMPDLTACSTGLTLGPLAKGIVEATADRRTTWEKLVASFRATENRSPELIACYLFHLNAVDADLAETVLDECLNAPLLMSYFPYLQKRGTLAGAGIERLKMSLRRKCAPAEQYRGLGWSSQMSDSITLELTPMILELEGGFAVALDNIHMRMIQERRDENRLSSELIAAGRLVAEACQFDLELNHDVHDLHEVIEECLATPDAIPTVERMLGRLREAHADFRLGFTEENAVLSALCSAQPIVMLNSLFAAPATDDRFSLRRFFDHDELIGSPLDGIPAETLFEWCDSDATVRYPLIAEHWTPFTKAPNSDKPQWKPTALTMLDKAPNRIEVLKHYIAHFAPMSWSGSRSATWAANVALLDQFENYPDAHLAELAKQRREELNRDLDEMRRSELNSERRENERFE